MGRWSKRANYVNIVIEWPPAVNTGKHKENSNAERHDDTVSTTPNLHDSVYSGGQWKWHQTAFERTKNNIPLDS